MTEPPRPKKVFCSHRSVDKPAVDEFARRLRAQGIDAWLDTWEIRAGDDLVQKINSGLASADFGLIFRRTRNRASGCRPKSAPSFST